jgi:hypothetical protein
MLLDHPGEMRKLFPMITQDRVVRHHPQTRPGMRNANRIKQSARDHRGTGMFRGNQILYDPGDESPAEVIRKRVTLRFIR